MSRVMKSLVALALVVALLQIAGAFLPDSRFWGFHQYAFLPRPFLLLPLLGFLLFVPGVARAVAGALNPLSRTLESKTGARAVAAITIAILALLFWLGRQRAFLLSDSELLIRSVNQGFVRFTADTLAAVIQLWFHYLLRHLHVTSETASFRIVSIGAGIVWLAAVFLATARLTRRGWERFLLGGLLATAGMTKLFYGYVETGPLLMAAVGVYIWAMVRWLQDGKGMIPATAAFLAAAAMHVTGLLLFPSYLFGLILWARRDSRRWIPAGVAVLLPVAAYMAYWFSRGGTIAGVTRAYAPYFSEFIPLTGAPGMKQAYTLFSFSHLLDFLNEQIFIGPFAFLAALVVFAALWRRSAVGEPAVAASTPAAASSTPVSARQPAAAASASAAARQPAAAASIPAAAEETGEPWVGPVRRFLLLAIAPFLLLSLIFNRKLGGARDWDLLATLAVPSIFFVALSFFKWTGAVVRQQGRRARGAIASTPFALPAMAVLLVVLSAVHLAGVILIDSDADRSLKHFIALFDEKAPVSRFARSYALEEIGHYYIGLGQPDAAAGWLEKAAVIDPSNIKAIGTLGSYYGAVGRHDEAVPLLREAVRQRPEVAMSHYNLAAELARTEKWNEAASAFAEAIRLDPRLMQAYGGLGIVYSRLGRLAEADSVLAKGLELYPGERENATLHLTRGTVLDRQGRLAEAEAAYREALKLDSDNREALFNLSRLLVNREAWNDAIPPLERLGRLAPEDAEAAVNLGVACLQTGRNQEAIEAFTRAIRANPRLPQAYLNLASALSEMGKPDEAVSVLEAFLSADPATARAMNVPGMLEQIRAHEPPAQR